MPKFSSKHGKDEQVFRFSGFDGGYVEDTEAQSLSLTQLSECMNLKYVVAKDGVVLNVRQGTTLVSNSALPAAADVLACTYYINASKYILATATKLYYLDGSSDPVEIGSSFLDGVPTFTEFNSKLIIHDSGITKFWDGTTSPVLDTNYGKIDKTFIDELLATGDNAETEFSGQLDNRPLTPGTLAISFTDSTTKAITADGTGRLTGNVSTDWIKTITDAVDEGGLIRLTSVAHGMENGDEINVADILGTVEANSSVANPTWTIKAKTNDTVDLTGSVFSNAYISGGTMSKNVIDNFTDGTYNFKCDGAPDNVTSILATYDEKDGAPKSKGGLVRGSRLYTWGDGDNTSRLTYTEVNDLKATDTSSGGGYLDVDPNDGYTLLGGLNFFTTVLLFKQYSLHRIDDFPDDTTFAVEKLTDNLGTVSHRTPLFEGGIVSFISEEGWMAMHPSQRFGDIQRAVPLSKDFKNNAVRYANSTAYSEFNPTDNQLWLSLSTDGGTTYLDYIYVQNLDVNGLVSLYKFAFSHTCFTYANGEMLIGGADGNLYKLDDTNTVFTDNEVAYSHDTYFRGAYTDWGLPNNRKHNKKILVRVATEASSFTAKLKIFRDGQYQAFRQISVSTTASYPYVYGSDIYVYDMANMPIFPPVTQYTTKNKFDYLKLMYELREISVTSKTDIKAVEFTSAIIGG
jgi:hypothetical protein